MLCIIIPIIIITVQYIYSFVFCEGQENTIKSTLIGDVGRRRRCCWCASSH